MAGHPGSEQIWDPFHFHCLSPRVAWEPAHPGPPLGRPSLEVCLHGLNVYGLLFLDAAVYFLSLLGSPPPPGALGHRLPGFVGTEG